MGNRDRRQQASSLQDFYNAPPHWILNFGTLVPEANMVAMVVESNSLLPRLKGLLESYSRGEARKDTRSLAVRKLHHSAWLGKEADGEFNYWG